MDFPAELGEAGSWLRLMDLGCGGMWQLGWRPFSRHYFTYFLVLPKDFFTEEDEIGNRKSLPPPQIIKKVKSLLRGS